VNVSARANAGVLRYPTDEYCGLEELPLERHCYIHRNNGEDAAIALAILKDIHPAAP
jgi:hypothetical protein